MVQDLWASSIILLILLYGYRLRDCFSIMTLKSIVLEYVERDFREAIDRLFMMRPQVNADDPESLILVQDLSCSNPRNHVQSR